MRLDRCFLHADRFSLWVGRDGHTSIDLHDSDATLDWYGPIAPSSLEDYRIAMLECEARDRRRAGRRAEG